MSDNTTTKALGPTEVRSTDMGDLQILHLKRIWANALCGNHATDPDEAHMSMFVLDGLELGTGETHQFLLQQRPDFAAFESWVLEKCGGAISPAIREKINRAVSDCLSGQHKRYPLPPNMDEPVLDERALACWEKNGYVVLNEAVPREDCAALENAMWKYLGMRPDDPPARWREREELFWVNGFHHPLLDKNRQSQRIHRAFAQIWGTEDLFHSVNRVSFNPPLDAEWNLYGPCNLHWDASIAQPMPFDVIGLLYLNDVAENQGAFQCVPGFHREIDSWLGSLPPGADPRKEILDSFDPVKIAGKAGDLIVWRQELPHGSSINRADYPRFAQYMAMYPADRTINPVWK